MQVCKHCERSNYYNNSLYLPQRISMTGHIFSEEDSELGESRDVDFYFIKTFGGKAINSAG